MQRGDSVRAFICRTRPLFLRTAAAAYEILRQKVETLLSRGAFFGLIRLYTTTTWPLMNKLTFKLSTSLTQAHRMLLGIFLKE